MSEVAAQPVDRPHQHRLDLAACNAVAQRFQRRTLEGCAAEAVIGEHACVGNQPAAPACMVQNRLMLTGDRLASALNLARHPQVRRHRPRRTRHRYFFHPCYVSSWTRIVREPGRRRLLRDVLARSGRRLGAAECAASGLTPCRENSRLPAPPESPGFGPSCARVRAAAPAEGAGCAR